MKKINKILATSALIVGASMGAVGCGEIYITFETNNGGTLVDLEYNKNTFVQDVQNRVSTLSKPGYKVEGVYLDAEFTQPITNVTSEMKKDFKLYIKWELADIAIRYNANTGTGTISDKYITYTQTGLISTDLTSITKTGYALSGWNTKADGTGETYYPGQEYTMNSTEPVTLYAMWTARSYSVVYDKNAESATGNPIAFSHVFNENFEITDSVYTRAGYDFVGWNTKADGTGTTYHSGDSVKLATTGTTFYAQWRAKKYTVSFAKGGTDIVGDQIAALQNVEFDSKFTIPQAEYSRPGFSFVGWRIEGSGATLTAGQQVDMIYANNITLYPVWEMSNLPFALNEVTNTGNKFVVNYTEDSNSYEYAFVQGQTYTFPASVTLVSVTDTNLATISGNALTINNVGGFNLRLARTSDNNDIWDIKVLAKTGEYTINYVDADGGEIRNNKWPDFSDTEKNDYVFGVEEEVPAITTTGYTFNGWELRERAYIGGTWREAGYLLQVNPNSKVIIPAHTFGNLKLKAKFTINHNEIKFYSGSTLIETIDGDFGTDWDICNNFDEQKLISDMITNAPSGKMFAGWYTSNTNFADSNKFSGIVYPNSISVYARYIDVPTKPAELTCSDSSVIIWTEGQEPEGVSLSYELYINGEKSVSSVNSIDASLVMQNKGKYVIKVRTVYSIANSDIDFENTVYSDYTTIEYNKTEGNSGTGMVEVVDGEGQTVKRVMFNGMTYNFNYKASNLASVFSIKDVSTDGLVDLTITDEDDGSKTCTLVIADDKTGTFKITQHGSDRLIEVVENISTISVGDAYANYQTVLNKYDTNESLFMDKTAQSVTNEYLVGTENAFKFDLKLYNTKLAEYSSTYNFANEEYIKYVFEVYDEGEDKWVNANTAYYDISNNVIEEELASGRIACSPIRNGAEISFPQELGQYGLKYKVTAYLIYSRSGNNPTKFDINNLDLTEFKDKVTFEITLNNGYNVYTNAELKAAYGDFTKHVINVHNNITAELDEHQSQADGSPINIGSSRVYDNDDTTSNNATTQGEYKTDGNIYKRVSRKVTNDKVVVNGNFCTIDASGVKLVSFDYNTERTSSDNGVNHQVGLLGGGDEFSIADKFLRSHTSVFRYQCPKGDGLVNNNTAIFNNLNIIGNKAENLPENATNDEKNEYNRLQSGSIVGIYCENSNVVVNNTNIVHTHLGLRAESANQANGDNGLYGTVECNFVNIENTYSEAIYGWNGKKIKMFNSKISNCGAIAIRLDDTKGTCPTVIFDKNTVVDNYMTGTEVWFANWAMTPLALQLKQALQPALNSFGASALKKVDGKDTFANLIFCYQPTGIVNNNYKCTTSTGGTKVLCDKEDSRAIGYVYDENSNIVAGYYMQDEAVSSKTYSDVKTDSRAQSGMLAFTQSYASTNDQFLALQGAFAMISEDLPKANNVTSKYVSNAISYDAVKKLCSVNSVARISEEVFNALADYTIKCMTDQVQMTPENALTYLVTNQVLTPEEAQSEKVKKQLVVLWNNLQTPISELGLDYSDTLLGLFGEHSIMELKLNGYCVDPANEDPASIDLTKFDYTEYRVTILTAGFIAKNGNQEKDIETLGRLIGAVVAGYPDEALTGLGATPDLIALIRAHVEARLNDGYLGVRDELVIKLVEELSYINGVQHESLGNSTIMQYFTTLTGGDSSKLTALVGQFVLYRLGVTINGNDRVMELITKKDEVVNPDSDNPTIYEAPMLILITTGTLTDTSDVPWELQ